MAQPQYPPYGGNPQYGGQFPPSQQYPAANPWQPGPQQAPQQFYVPPEVGSSVSALLNVGFLAIEFSSKKRKAPLPAGSPAQNL
jgi:hypothetical protein